MKRITVRPFRRSDFKAWVTASVEGRPSQNAFDRGPVKPGARTHRAFLARLRRYQTMAKIDSCYVYGVFESRTGRLVGVVDIMVMCRGHHQMGNLGYRIFNQYWRQGFATEAVKIVMKKAFVELRLHRLEASADTGNRASIALARSLGLHDEGTRRKYIFDRGAWRDHRVFVALPETVGLRAKPPRFK